MEEEKDVYEKILELLEGYSVESAQRILKATEHSLLSCIYHRHNPPQNK